MKNIVHGGDIYNHHVAYDFSVNVNPLGVPPVVKAALKKAVLEVERYPEIGSERLRQALAKKFGVPAKLILCGNGASELFTAITASLRPDRIAVTAPSFGGYAWAAKTVGAELVTIPLKEEDGFAVTGDILEYLTNDIDLLFLTNPNNPVGTVIEPELMRRILQQCKKNYTVVVLDECFIEFTNQKSCVNLLDEFQNLVIVRAFTKTMAIPGVRLGYMLFSARMRERLEIHLPEWNLSVFAQEAGLAILEENENWNMDSFMETSRKQIEKEKAYLSRGLKNLGLPEFKIYTSEANFLMLYTEFPLYDYLLEKEILIRDCSNYPGLKKGYYRIAVRTHKENKVLLEALERWN